MQCQRSDPALRGVEVGQHHIIARLHEHWNEVVGDEIKVKLDLVVEPMSVDLGLVGGPVFVAFPSDEKLVVRRQVRQGFQQHAESFVRPDEPKKEVGHISI